MKEPKFITVVFRTLRFVFSSLWVYGGIIGFQAFSPLYAEVSKTNSEWVAYLIFMQAAFMFLIGLWAAKPLIWCERCE